jgi:hypothetical protein
LDERDTMRTWPNKSLQATRDGDFSSASRFTLVGPARLSSGRSSVHDGEGIG